MGIFKNVETSELYSWARRLSIDADRARRHSQRAKDIAHTITASRRTIRLSDYPSGRIRRYAAIPPVLPLSRRWEYRRCVSMVQTSKSETFSGASPASTSCVASDHPEVYMRPRPRARRARREYPETTRQTPVATFWPTSKQSGQIEGPIAATISAGSDPKLPDIISTTRAPIRPSAPRHPACARPMHRRTGSAKKNAMQSACPVISVICGSFVTSPSQAGSGSSKYPFPASARSTCSTVVAVFVVVHDHAFKRNLRRAAEDTVVFHDVLAVFRPRKTQVERGKTPFADAAATRGKPVAKPFQAIQSRRRIEPYAAGIAKFRPAGYPPVTRSKFSIVDFFRFHI